MARIDTSRGGILKKVMVNFSTVNMPPSTLSQCCFCKRVSLENIEERISTLCDVPLLHGIDDMFFRNTLWKRIIIIIKVGSDILEYRNNGE